MSLRWNILDRLSTFTALKNNNLQQESAELYIEKRTQLVNNQLQTAFDNYDYAKQLYDLDATTMINAEEIYSIAQKAYANGSLTDLELK